MQLSEQQDVCVVAEDVQDAASTVCRVYGRFPLHLVSGTCLEDVLEARLTGAAAFQFCCTAPRQLLDSQDALSAALASAAGPVQPGLVGDDAALRRVLSAAKKAGLGGCAESPLSLGLSFALDGGAGGGGSTPVLDLTRAGTVQNTVLHVPVDLLLVLPLTSFVTLRDQLAQALQAFWCQVFACLHRHGLQRCPTAHYFPVGKRLLRVLYPSGLDDAQLLAERREAHEQLLLPLTRPLFRIAQRVRFAADRQRLKQLLSPHLRVRLPQSTSSGANGESTTSLVRGHYTYHHYNQDGMPDSGWGCAYRSLQTLASWLNFQGFCEAAVPSHKAIQQALVAVGDKPAGFVNSRQWIGSMEVGFALEHLCGVTCRIVHVGRGADLPDKCRELAAHFDSVGAPVMVGGGVLAHTLLGVHWQADSSTWRFLILDPHYTGTGKDERTVIDKGFCAWKGANFWDQEAHYNFCLPQPPQCF